jgi:hypothetical protein
MSGLTVRLDYKDGPGQIISVSSDASQCHWQWYNQWLASWALCSISVATAFLMKRHSISMDEALARIRARRPIMSPNPGFVAQLREFENLLLEAQASQKQLEMSAPTS